MKIQNLYQPYNIECIRETAHREPASLTKNTYFEMVFVLEGEGVQYINDLSLPYAENKLFLIFPQDTYGFEIEKPTTFFVLRFNNSFLKSRDATWRNKLEYIFRHHNHLPGCILKNVTDKPLVRSLAEALLREQESGAMRNEELEEQLVYSIITVAARNIELMNVPCADFTPINGISQMLDYIHQNISNPEALKVPVIAFHFNISETYFCEYFKKRTGQSPMRYVAAYKQRLIERELQFSNLRITEISDKLGFSDTSHFNHFFKKHAGLSPLEFRQKVSWHD